MFTLIVAGHMALNGTLVLTHPDLWSCDSLQIFYIRCFRFQIDFSQNPLGANRAPPKFHRPKRCLSGFHVSFYRVDILVAVVIAFPDGSLVLGLVQRTHHHLTHPT